MIGWKRTSSAVLTVLLGSLIAQGQSAIPTNNALLRTYMVQVGAERGSIFTIEVDKREYWITAKHVLTGAKHPPYGEYKQPSALISILANPASQGEQWLTERFSVLDPERYRHRGSGSSPSPRTEFIQDRNRGKGSDAGQ